MALKKFGLLPIIRNAFLSLRLKMLQSFVECSVLLSLY